MELENKIKDLCVAEFAIDKTLTVSKVILVLQRIYRQSIQSGK